MQRQLGGPDAGGGHGSGRIGLAGHDPPALSAGRGRLGSSSSALAMMSRAIGAAVRAAAAAVLDHHGERVARLVIGREGDEQGVVALLPGLLLVLAQAGQALAARDAPHLRGAGLAGHGERRPG